MGSSKWIVALLLFVVGLVGWVYLAGSATVRFGAQATPEAPGTGWLVYGFAMTLIGVYLGSSFRELRRIRDGDNDGTINPGSFFAGVFRLIDFWMGACAAPIVYALLVRNLDGGGYAGLTVIALENGFCATLIASQILAPNSKAEDDS